MGKRVGFLAGRVIGIFVVASLLLFLAVETMPEDPVSLRVKNPDPERVEEIRESLGLNDPAPVRYFRFLGNFFRGEWGQSLITGRSVREDIGRYLPATLELSVCAIFFGVTFGIGTVLMAHLSGWSVLLQISRALGALGLTIPIFWIGLIFILLFSVGLGWLPVGGRFDFALAPPNGTGFYLMDTLFRGDFSGFGVTVKHLFLPVCTLALFPTAVVAGTLEGRLQDHRVTGLVRGLRSRGFSRVRIWWRHILRLMSGPVITVIGTQAGALIGGAVLTETVYSWPGLGRYLVDGVLNRDLFVIQNGLLLIVLLALVLVSLSDFITVRLNRNLGDRDS